MKLIEVNTANTTTNQRSSSQQRTSEIPSLSSPSSWAPRTNEQIRSLVNNVRKPPLGYGFSIEQRQQQANFFKWMKDYIVPLDNVDLYNADIVAVGMY